MYNVDKIFKWHNHVHVQTWSNDDFALFDIGYCHKRFIIQLHLTFIGWNPASHKVAAWTDMNVWQEENNHDANLAQIHWEN